MSAPTPETLAELRRLLDEAPPLPYRDSPATHGDPSNGPTYVALEAQREGRWEEVATGNYEKWCGMGIALAAAAVNALPALLDAAAERDALAAKLDAVRALHRPVDIYDECECSDEAKAEGHEDVEEVGLTCNRMYTVCAECSRDDVYQYYHDHKPDEAHHCPTIRALDGGAES